MVKIYPHVAGNTLGAHKKILKKIRKKGAEVLKNPNDSDYTIVFCPIVSRFETDIKSALSDLPEEKGKVIVVAMHHTFNPKYTLPTCRGLDEPAVLLLVDYLFHEKMGLLKCSCNKESKKKIYKELDLAGRGRNIFKKN